MLRKSLGGLVLAGLAGVYLACAPAATKAPAPPAAPPLAVETSLSNKFVKAGASQSLTARISLNAKRRSSTARPPVNLALVIDTSGSMEGKPIEDARAAALKLLDALAPEDRLSVVVFHSKAEVLLSSTRVADADMRELRKKISAMKAQGTTDMADGLQMGISEVAGNLNAEGVNRVVLVGDGVANDDAPVLPQVAQAAARGISVTTLGLGLDYDETLMAKIAQESGGKFHHVEDSNRVASFFAEEVTRLHKVVARGATLHVRPGPGIIVTGCVGRPGGAEGRGGLAIPLGDVTLGDELEIICDLAGPAAKDGANVEVLDAVVSYTEGVGGMAREETSFAGAKATMDPKELTDGRNAKVETAASNARDAAKTILLIQQQRASDRAKTNNANEPINRVNYAPAPAAAPPPKEQLRMNDEALHRLGY